VYQGTELWEDSLVDPDNRRRVDFRVRRTALADLTHPKMRVVRSALHLRRRRPDTFLAGGYGPVFAHGAAAEHVISFRRGQDVLVAVGRWTTRLDETGWGDTTLTVPEGRWTDLLTGTEFTGAVLVGDLFGELPSPYWSERMPEHEFAVWAPRPQLVRLDVDGALQPDDPV